MDNLIPVSYKLLKGMNESLILNVIRERGPISRSDIAKLTNLTPPTVTNITNRLLESELIFEYMMGESSGGRPPVLLKINPEAFNIIVVHISSNKINAYLTDVEINVKDKLSEGIPVSGDRDWVIDRAKEFISKLMDESDREIEGIGVIVHGPAKSREGISLFAPNLGWRNVPIKSIIEEKYDIPVFVENDVRAMALGEYWYGSGKDVNNMVFLKVGYGLGSAIVLDGSLYRGINDSAGEVGHTTIDISGPRCSCGNYGCFEALASEHALTQRFIKAIKEGQYSHLADEARNIDEIAPSDIYTAAREGDGLALSIMDQEARYLGIGIANIFNIFNPELVVIGGGITEARDLIEEKMIETVEERSLESCYGSGNIVFSKLGDEATLKGAANMVLKEVI
jgi:transcriptional regulator, MarR family